MIEKLYVDAEASKAVFRARLADLSPQELEAWRGNTLDYRALYAKAKDIHLAVSRRTATLLYILARTRGARSIVEFGTSFGISTLHLGAALRDNGGGRLIGTEFEPGKVAAARASIAEAHLSDIVEIREGDAVETLARDLPDSIDLVFLDGAGSLYLKIARLLEPRLDAGSLLVADNAHGAPDYLDHVRSSGRFMSLDLDKDVEISVATHSMAEVL
ncbi:O-methyltransferase [Promicromonospora sp. NFX87]|uniref:O-methyltransferase n=1 Tax=Promicromonospora sp. NFX87 TaxID=3402691 RepID=UPI003AFAE84E